MKLSIDQMNDYFNKNKEQFNNNASQYFNIKLQQNGNLNLASLINICKESHKQVNKTKLLLKSKVERERMKLERIIPKIKFNKYELLFILDKKNKNSTQNITIQVHNELNNEMFILDERECLVKLKLLNQKEKFLIKVNSNFNNIIQKDVLFLDLEEKFGSDEINLDKVYNDYTLNISLSILDKKQQDEYKSYKDIFVSYSKLKYRIEELEEFLYKKIDSTSFSDCFIYLNRLFELEDLGSDISALTTTFKYNSTNNVMSNNQPKQVNDFSFKNNVKEITLNNESKSNSYIEEESSFFGDTNSFIAMDNHIQKNDEISSNPLNRVITAKKNMTQNTFHPLTTKSKYSSEFNIQNDKLRNIKKPGTMISKDQVKIENQEEIQNKIFNSINNDANGVFTQENVLSPISKGKMIINEKEDSEEVEEVKVNNLRSNPKNIIPKQTKLVSETKQQIKAEANPFKKSPAKLLKKPIIVKNYETTPNLIIPPVITKIEQPSKEDFVDDKLKQIINNKNTTETKMKLEEKGSLISLLNIGLRGSPILFCSAKFKITTVYENYIKVKKDDRI